MAIETRTAAEVTNEWRPRTLSVAARPPSPIEVDGKYFKAAGARFPFRGVIYGTFAQRNDGALFPEIEQLRADLGSIAAAGFTVVRTYTTPPPDMLEASRELGLRVLAG